MRTHKYLPAWANNFLPVGAANIQPPNKGRTKVKPVPLLVNQLARLGFYAAALR